jgi:integrase
VQALQCDVGEMAAAPQRLPQILSREELAPLLAAARHEVARTFLRVAYATGLRTWSSRCRTNCSPWRARTRAGSTRRC